MQERLLKYTLVCGILFFTVSMAAMLEFAAHKTIVIAEETAGENMAEQRAEEAESRDTLTFAKSAGAGDILYIPLPKEVRADDIVMENRYMEHALNVVLQGNYGGFYQTHALNGNSGRIVEGHVYEEGETTRLKLQLSGLYEHQYLFENGRLQLKFVPPGDLYERIVVIDAAHGGEDIGVQRKDLKEKDIVLDIVNRVRGLLEAEDIRVYYTRLDDTEPALSERIDLANELRADMLISVHANADESNEKIYGIQTFCNSRYFIPGLGNVQLADFLEREVVTAVGGKANGLFEADGEDYLLMNAQVPAAIIEVGYISNPEEAAFLQQEEYRQKLAEGIYQAICKAYEWKESNT